MPSQPYRPILLARALGLAAVLLAPGAWAQPNMESGTITLLDTFVAGFTTVNLQHDYTDPVIFLTPSNEGGDACGMRIASISAGGGSDSFTTACLEPPAFDGQHIAMTVHYFVIEKGLHDFSYTDTGGNPQTATILATTLDDQTPGNPTDNVPPVQHFNDARFTVGGCDSPSYFSASFTAAFPSTPIVLAQVQGMANESQAFPFTASTPWLSTAVNNVSTTGFDLALEHAEVDNNCMITGTSNFETIGFLAMDGDIQGSFTPDSGPDIDFETIVTTTAPVTHSCTAVNYVQTYSTSAKVLAHTNSRVGSNGGWLRRCAVGANSVTLRVEEDTDLDAERSHIGEEVSVLVFSDNFEAGALLSRAVVADFNAHATPGGATVTWNTRSEISTVGFHLERWDAVESQWVRLNRALLPALLHARNGGAYQYRDADSRQGDSVRYRLVELEASGRSLVHGPYDVTVLPAADAPPPAAANDRRVSRVLDNLDRTQRRERRQAAIDRVRGERTGSRLKISIREPGLYVLDAETLASALGKPVSELRRAIRNNQVRLTLRGRRVATWRAGRDDRVYFYGRAVGNGRERASDRDRPDWIYTDENVYWLSLQRGLKMRSVRRAAAPRPSTPGAFRERVHAAGNRFSIAFLSDDADDDNWVWDYRIGGLDLPDCEQSDQTSGCYVNQLPIESHGRIAEGRAQLVVRLHGASDAGVGNPHQASVSLNGTPLGTMTFPGLTPAEHTFEFDAGVLRDGENTVAIDAAASGDPARPSVFYINDLTLSYRRAYRAYENALVARSARRPVLEIAGFSDRNIHVFDLTRPNRPARVRNLAIGGAPGNFRVRFRAPRGTRTYLATTLDRARSPVAVFADRPSRLRATNRRVDWLLITTGDLVGPANALARLRESEGLRTLVVDVEDIYDEFNHGIRNADAIWAFLRRAHRGWRVGPRYVVLAGEGSNDYRNHLGFGDALIPTLMAPTDNGLVPSDNLLADVVGGDYQPEFAIGRLPVIDAAELTAVVAKLVGYAGADAGSDWATRAITAADPSERANNFVADAQSIAGMFPEAFSVDELYLDEIDFASARTEFLEAWGSGRAFVHFAGHSSHISLGNHGLLRPDDIAGLANGARLPVVTAQTCLIAQFGLPGQESLGERLLLAPDGGAIAVWGASGLALNHDGRTLTRAFYQSTFPSDPHAPGELVLGEAILSAQASFAALGRDLHVLDLFNLIGDPATIMK